jgi:hypothetical protein
MKVTLIIEKNGTINDCTINIDNISELDVALEYLKTKAETFTFNTKQQQQQIQSKISQDEIDKMFYEECIKPQEDDDGELY